MTPLPQPGSSKADWRRWARDTRAGLDIPALSRAIVKKLEAWPSYQNATHVLTYLAFGSELTLSSLGGKRFYATRTREDGSLSVHALTGELEAHPYGFYEPSAANPEVEVESLELLLVPGLAFSRSGVRLGYGKGFYDRLLPRLTPGTPLVGVAPSALIVEMLPEESHDVRMTHLLSEKGVREVSW
jgi:5-formyltetrahydrofolate cyclo-ligase